MTTTISQSPSAVTTYMEDEFPAAGPLLLATDTSASSAAAARAARLLASHTGADVKVLTVLEPVILPDPDTTVRSTILDELGKEELLKQAKEQIRTVAGETADWPIQVELGRPATMIARVARQQRARMIIMGLNHHSVIDRLLGGDTALGVIRLANVPVLIVGPAFTDLPRRVLIAVDFSPSSVTSARAALPLLGHHPTVYVVHVKQKREVLTPAAPWDLNYEQRIPAAFHRLAAELNLPSDVDVDTITLTGNPAREILDFADAAGSELIVAGSHGRSPIQRMLLGSVATKLVRGSNCSVLIVPEAASGRIGRIWQDEAEARTEAITDSALWAARLKEFTKRNAFRRVLLEVDDPDYGSQVEASDYQFLGADFDRRSDRVEVLLGDSKRRGARHLTHGVSGVTSIDTLSDAKGRDEALRIAHGAGQTLITFPS